MAANNPTNLSAASLLSAARLIIYKKCPYFRIAMLSIVYRAMPGYGTCTSFEGGIMGYDPLKIVEWTLLQMAGVIVHEWLHMFLKHHKRIGKRDEGLWNWACDIVANQMVLALGLHLPGKPLTPERFGLPKDRTVEWYYDELEKQQKQGKPEVDPKAQRKPGSKPKQGQGQGQKPGQKPGQQPGQDQGKQAQNAQQPGQNASQGQGQQSGQDQGQQASQGQPGGAQQPQDATPLPGEGWCGSAAGRPVEGEPDATDPDRRSDNKLERLIAQVASDIKEAESKSQGALPAGLVRLAEAMLKQPKINWRLKLRHNVRSGLRYRPGATRHDYRFPSRRQAALGYGINKPIIPRYTTTIPRVTIVLDTSASMSRKDLSEALTETDAIMKALGAEVTFMSCDAAVHSCGKVRNIEELLPMVKGGGGTSFVPAFKRIDKERDKPDLVVFFTDGHGTAPSKEPVGYKTMWILIGKGVRNPCASFGEVVRVEEDEQEDRAA